VVYITAAASPPRILSAPSLTQHWVTPEIVRSANGVDLARERLEDRLGRAQ
jgi:hypothetical protein